MFLTLVSEIFIISVSRQFAFVFFPSLKDVLQSGPLNPPQLEGILLGSGASEMSVCQPLEKQPSSSELFSPRTAAIARDHSLIIDTYVKVNCPNFSFPMEKLEIT